MVALGSGNVMESVTANKDEEERRNTVLVLMFIGCICLLLLLIRRLGFLTNHSRSSEIVDFGNQMTVTVGEALPVVNLFGFLSAHVSSKLVDQIQTIKDYIEKDPDLFIIFV